VKNLYAIRDTKAKSYGPLMAIQNDVVAIREFGAAIEGKDSPFARYADDFELVCCGQYHDDDDADDITPVIGTSVRVVVTAAAWISSRQRVTPQGSHAPQLNLLEG